MKWLISGFLLTLFPISFTEAADLVFVPSGRMEAFWLTPVSKKAKKPSSKTIIQIREFRMQRYQVTVREFKEFLNSNPEWSKERASGLFKDDYYLSDLDSAPPKAPVTFVSWFAARAYCESKGLRLPTTNEWEYVAAASEKNNDANKEESFLRRILNWYAEPQGERLKDIGSIYKNIYGVWDMHGLVWEWVDDFNSNFVTGESREDGSFNKDMFCGAGALSSADKENYAAFMRFAFRSGLKGKSSTWNLGFRCAK
ncbi:MAG: formylglycine-generating enzyme family protein [Bdellovibrionaceae bacterium]|nr:formylglycine-generating enzyme family protein [Pseudobdellovibrionaceae bacterium]